MGKRGPKPLPTAMKLLTANPGKTFDSREPQVAPAAPECPDHLSPEAKREWHRLASQLVNHGPVVRSPSGFPCQNPWLPIANKALTLMRGFASELGLSPSSRSTIRVSASAMPADDFEEYKLNSSPMVGEESA